MDSFDRIRRQLEVCDASLVAVSKTKPADALLNVYDRGQRDFGENRVQDLVAKYDQMPKDIQWHMIGHLQKNKVKYIASFVHMIHSADNFKLLEIIEKYGRQYERKIKVLLQLKIASEDTKYGMSEEECTRILENPEFKKLQFVEVCGVMGMASFTEDKGQIRSEFKNLKSYFNSLKDTHFALNPHFKEISMGMSGDYEIALQEGSTMVRIGSLIFGPRE